MGRKVHCMGFALRSLQASVLLLALALASCSKTNFKWSSTTEFALTSTSKTLELTEGLTVNVLGGVPPFTFTSTGLANWTRLSDRTFIFNRTWEYGPSQLLVRDALGNVQRTSVIQAPGLVELGASRTTTTYATGLLPDGKGNYFLYGTTTGSFVASDIRSGTHFFVAKFNANAKLLWIAQLFQLTVEDIRVTSSGNFVLGGSTKLVETTSLVGGSHGTNDPLIVEINGETGSKNWAYQIGPVTITHASAIGTIKKLEIDNNGNILFYGKSTDASFTWAQQTGQTNAPESYFVGKLNQLGAQQWLHQVGCGSQFLPYYLRVDSSQNTIITGTVNETNCGGGGFSPDAAITLPTGAISSGTYEPYIAKFNHDSGILTWQTAIVSDGLNLPTGLFIDSSDNILSTGSTNGSYTCSAPTTCTYLDGTHTAGNFTANIFKLDSSGGLVWTRQVAKAGAVVMSEDAALGSDDQLVLINSVSGGTLTTGAESRIGSLGSSDLHVIKISQTGAKTWAAQVGQPSVSVQPKKLHLTADNDVFIRGSNGGGGLGVGVAAGYELIGSVGGTDAFVARFSSAGAFTYLTEVGNGTSQVNNISSLIDDSGRVRFLGSTDATVDPLTLTGTQGSMDLFAMELAANGSPIWTRELGAVDATAVPTSIFVDSSGNIYFAGYSSEPLNPVTSVDGAVVGSGKLIGGLGAQNSFFGKLNSKGEVQ